MNLRDCMTPVWESITDLYAQQTREIPFHGWHHVSFVARNAGRFAEELGADTDAVIIAALVHDVNYLVAAQSDASMGTSLRQEILRGAGLDEEAIVLIEEIVITAETHVRDRNISREAMALVLAPLYMRETGKSVRELAEKIVGEQVPLRDDGIYFYSESAKKKYERWGDVNLALWSCILESLDEPLVVKLINQVEKYTGIPGEPRSRLPGNLG